MSEKVLFIKRWVLSFLFGRFKKNRNCKKYPQTWFYATRIRGSFPWTYALLQFLCWVVGGHELSETEWSYGGGDYADRWCRWCNKHFYVPKESVYFRFKDHDAKGLMSKVGTTIRDEGE